MKLIGGVDRTTRTADLGMVELTPGALGLDVEGGLIALSWHRAEDRGRSKSQGGKMGEER